MPQSIESISGSTETRLRAPSCPVNAEQTMSRYPRLTGHLICESLGYFSPPAAARALFNYIRKRPHWCEYYVCCAPVQGAETEEERLIRFNAERIAAAFRSRRSHTGFMASYPLARAHVQRAIAGIRPALPLGGTW